MFEFLDAIIDGKFFHASGFMGLIVLFAILIDLVSGIRKARQLGIARTSIGLRDTIKKIIQYMTVLLFGVMIDLLLYNISTWPYVTMAFSIGLVVIEGISVWEKAEVKLKKKVGSGFENAAIILQNVQDKEALLKAVSEIINKSTNEVTTTRPPEQ